MVNLESLPRNNVDFFQMALLQWWGCNLQRFYERDKKLIVTNMTDGGGGGGLSIAQK